MGVVMPASTATTAMYYGEHIEVKKCVKINVLFLCFTLVGIVALMPLATAVFN